jgi:hypothetical protein
MKLTFTEEGSFKLFVRGYSSWGGVFSEYADISVLVTNQDFSELQQSIIGWWDLVEDIEDKHINKLHLLTGDNTTPTFTVMGDTMTYSCLPPFDLSKYEPYPYLYMLREKSALLNVLGEDFSLVCWVRKDFHRTKYWNGTSWVDKSNYYGYPLSWHYADIEESGGIQFSWKDNNGNPETLYIHVSDGKNKKTITLPNIIEIGVEIFIAVSVDRDGYLSVYIGKNGVLSKMASIKINFNIYNYTEGSTLEIMERGGSRSVGSLNRLGIFRKALTDYEVDMLYNNGSGKLYEYL